MLSIWHQCVDNLSQEDVIQYENVPVHDISFIAPANDSSEIISAY